LAPEEREPLTARDHIRLAHIEREAEGYLELGMSEQALRTLDRLGDAAQLSHRAQYLRGEALRDLGRHAEALQPLRRAAKADPDNVHVWLAMAWCHKRTDRIDLAIKAMERALEIEPSEALVHYNLACYLSLTGDKQRALTHLSRAVTLDSRYRMLAHEEPDFDPIRSDPGFQDLTSIIV
jgi:Flp pilus assembly protein TadD